MDVYITASPGISNLSFSSIYLKIWQGLVVMEKDPHIEVANMTKLLTEYIRNKVTSLLRYHFLKCIYWFSFSYFNFYYFLLLNVKQFQAKEILSVKEGDHNRSYTYSSSSNDSMERSVFVS